MKNFIAGLIILFSSVYLGLHISNISMDAIFIMALLAIANALQTNWSFFKRTHGMPIYENPPETPLRDNEIRIIVDAKKLLEVIQKTEHSHVYKIDNTTSR